MNFKLCLSFDGSRYRGWQRLGDSEMTIQGKLETVLSRMAGVPVEVIGSGRTDAGAHALCQVANFHCETEMAAEQILEYLRHYLPEDIGVISVEPVDERFHSRYHAKSKTYRYRIWNSEKPCVFDRRYVWVVPDTLDVSKMDRAAKLFLGEHDFRAFCSNKHFKKSSVRTIYAFTVERQEDEIVFTVSGDGFLYNMVRIMIGTLLDIGKGQSGETVITEILSSKVRENAGITVPAKGLCLMEVVY